ncbi:MAG: shikimate dehydrogenase [Prevotellaceae bacterium]|jgi:shikimate dehydrogenase|nr:shikimate dehydrogenase [Prevotellaceae bacterium]
MKQFSVFGNPIEHSISPKLHNAAFKALRIDANYSKTLLENGGKLREKFLELRLCGANITVPHKEAAFAMCDDVVGIAREIEAVNTIVQKNARLIGFNTDAGGFLRAIKEFGEIKNALILGAGGTAKAIAFMLKENGVSVDILNRSKERLSFFQEKGFLAFSHEDFRVKKYDIVINTTSAGLKDDALPAPRELINEILKNAKFGFDVIYGRQTPFLHLCEENTLTYKDGLDMLLYQAVLAFNLFFDNAYDEGEIAKAMKFVTS